MAGFFETNFGKAIIYGGAGLLVLLAGYSIYSNVGTSDIAADSANRVWICSETGKQFNYKLKIGDRVPVLSPYSGKSTGYEPELCYWTKDGKTKDKPTYVLLKTTMGQSGPTFCPDCGRLVVFQNPVAVVGGTPPRSEGEMKAQVR